MGGVNGESLGGTGSAKNGTPAKRGGGVLALARLQWSPGGSALWQGPLEATSFQTISKPLSRENKESQLLWGLNPRVKLSSCESGTGSTGGRAIRVSQGGLREKWERSVRNTCASTGGSGSLVEGGT